MKNSVLNSRIASVSSQFSIPTLTLDTAFNWLGISDDDVGVKILEAATTTFDDFYDAIKQTSGNPVLDNGEPAVPYSGPRLKLAWEILKGRDPFAPSFDADIKELAQKAGKKVEEVISEMGISLDEFKKLGRDTAISLFKRIANASKAMSEGSSEFAEALKAIKPVGQWSDTEVLEHYGKHCSSDIEAELIKRSKSRNCILFNDDGSVDVKNSLDMLRLARYQDMPGTIGIPGCRGIKVLYKVGEFPADVLYECPIHSNVLLVNGYCEDCGKVWDTGDYERNVFLRLISASLFCPESDLSRHFSDTSLEDLKKRFAKVVPMYEDMKAEGTLPSLKRRVSRSKNGDPFRVSHVRH